MVTDLSVAIKQESLNEWGPCRNGQKQSLQINGARRVVKRFVS